jgi:hypothetical protein
MRPNTVCARVSEAGGQARQPLRRPPEVLVPPGSYRYAGRPSSAAPDLPVSNHTEQPPNQDRATYIRRRRDRGWLMAVGLAWIEERELEAGGPN